jgi:hypothetical protein|tara:strand:+ start:946 stop:1134 length:189 start_codon:yes stop_codon:yes gene_type:complete
MNEITKTLHNISEQVTDAIYDAEKFDGGNNSAGTRVRKAMQAVKALAQEVRTQVQEQKNVMA